MKTHELKVWPEFFEMLLKGKPFEVRENNRDYQVGDQLNLNEWVPSGDGSVGYFTQRVFVAYVTCIVGIDKVPGLSVLNRQSTYVVLGLSARDTYSVAKLPENVHRLAGLMAVRLAENNDKGPADKIMLTRGQLMDQLQIHIWELGNAVNDLEHGKDGSSAAIVEKKAADVANYALFVAQWAWKLMGPES